MIQDNQLLTEMCGENMPIDIKNEFSQPPAPEGPKSD
jgi:hypothetical protein